MNHMKLNRFKSRIVTSLEYYVRIRNIFLSEYNNDDDDSHNDDHVKCLLQKVYDNKTRQKCKSANELHPL